jgi:hypothetical protein
MQYIFYRILNQILLIYNPANTRCTLTAFGAGQLRLWAIFGFRTPGPELPNRRQVSFYVIWPEQYDGDTSAQTVR